MTDAEQAIADLDDELAKTGQWIEFQRLTGTALIPFTARVRASVRPITAKEIIGNLKQDASKVIISPSEISRSGWPGPNSSATPTAQDRQVPRAGDKAVIAGKTRNIEVAKPIYYDDALVRIEMDVLG